MQAIILAAGRGSRMDKLTRDKPKCMVRLAGKPLLDWQVESLRSAGILSIAAVCGYKAGQINLDGIEKFINPRWQATNMVQSLVRAASLLQAQTCVVSYSDIVYSPDAVRRLILAEGDIVITYDPRWLDLWSERFDDPLSDAETFRADTDGALVEIGGRAESLDEIEGQYMGLLKFTPQGWSQVESFLAGLSNSEKDQMDMTSLLKGLISGGAIIKTAPIKDRWYEVDSANDLMVYEKMIGSSPGSLWE